jgi:acyl carrier protein
MSTNIIGIKLPDEQWRLMKNIWDACTYAGVEVPDQVCVFF